MVVNLRQTHFRFGKDDGTEVTHTFWQLVDVNHTQLVDANWTFLLRFTEQETGNTAAANTDAQFQYNKNGAGWVNITTTSLVVKAVAVNAFTDGQACTKRLTGTGTFETTGAGCTEDGLSGGTANDIAALGNSETEAGLQVIAANVANNDTIQFRFTSPDWTVGYDVTPTLTITKTGGQTYEVNTTFSGSAAVSDSGNMIMNVSIPIISSSGINEENIASMNTSLALPSTSLTSQINNVIMEVSQALAISSLINQSNEAILESGLSFGASALIAQISELAGNMYNEAVSFSGSGNIQAGNNLEINPELSLLADGTIGMSNMINLVASLLLNGIGDSTFTNTLEINESVGMIGISDISNTMGLSFEESMELKVGGTLANRLIINGKVYRRVLGRIYIKI